MPKVRSAIGRIGSYPTYGIRYEFDWNDISPVICERYGLFLDNFDLDHHLYIEATYDPGEEPRLHGHPDNMYPGCPDGLDSLEIELKINCEDAIVEHRIIDVDGSTLGAMPSTDKIHVFSPAAIQKMLQVQFENGQPPEIGFDFLGMAKFITQATMGWVKKNEKFLEDLCLNMCRELHAKAVEESNTPDPDELNDRLHDQIREEGRGTLG